MHTFRPHEAGTVYHTNHTPSVLYPFIQVLFLVQHSNKGILSAWTLELFNPSHPCTGLLFDTVNEGFVLIHASRTPSTFLSGLCLRVFHTQSLTHRTFLLTEKTPFQVPLTTNAGLTFPCSPNPSSIFSSTVGCILENRVKALSCYLATKGPRTKSTGQKVKVWLSRDLAGH